MAGGEVLKLLGTASGVSPYVLRVQMALAIKGLSYEYLPVVGGGRKSSLLAASNPVNGKVPVLLHRGRPVCESLVILEYLEDAFPGSASILPADPDARFWAAFVDGTLFSSCIGILMRTTQEEKAEEEALRVLGLLEAHAELEEVAPFFGGDAVGFLDIAFGGYLPLIEGVGRLAGVSPALLDATRTPRLAAWAERFRAAEPVGALLPGANKVEEYATTVLYPIWKAAVTGN